MKYISFYILGKGILNILILSSTVFIPDDTPCSVPCTALIDALYMILFIYVVISFLYQYIIPNIIPITASISINIISFYLICILMILIYNEFGIGLDVTSFGVFAI